uniref:Uncharacterized protein n=1 Tax=Anopheles albimanus TaxID=7167 RepID=A0A182FXX4_ANOAL
MWQYRICDVVKLLIKSSDEISNLALCVLQMAPAILFLVANLVLLN